MTKVITFFTNKEQLSLDDKDYTCQTWLGIDMNIPSESHNAKDVQAMRFLVKEGIQEKLDLTTLTVLSIEFFNATIKQFLGHQPDYKAGEKPTLIIATNEIELSKRIQENTKGFLTKSSAEMIKTTKEFSENMISEEETSVLNGELHKSRFEFLCILLSCFFEISVLDLTKKDNEDMFKALNEHTENIFNASGMLDIASSSESEAEFFGQMKEMHENSIQYIANLESPAKYTQEILDNPIIKSSATAFMRDDVYYSGTVQ